MDRPQQNQSLDKKLILIKEICKQTNGYSEIEIKINCNDIKKTLNVGKSSQVD